MTKKLFEIQTDKIVKGSKLMYNNTALTSWTGNLSSLTLGSNMFYGCTNLETFISDLSSLSVGATNMFRECTALTTFTTNMSSLTLGNNMFYGCTNLTTFTSDLSSLTDAWDMFNKCTNLTTFTSDLSSLYSASGMFAKCKNLTTFNCGDMSSLRYASNMFDSCESLTTFISDLSSLENGYIMFYGCTNLTTFSSNLRSLVEGQDMFNQCKNLTTFNCGDLSSLTSGKYMFNNCSKLTTFNSDLSSLTNGSEMFSWCTALTTFNADLSSLTDGNRMFHLCSLNAPSVKNIAVTINRTTSNARFDIGVDMNIANDSQVKKDLGLIKQKGWNLWINGSNMAMNYTLPKYAGCTTVENVKAKDANYKTNDIVSGVWGEHLPDLTTGYPTEGDAMFYNCKTLVSFTADLSSLSRGQRMFTNCSNLSTFTSNLNSLTNGSTMFSGCSNITSFNTKLRSLTNGRQMFYNCSKLTTFKSTLRSLTDGTGMFYGCKLNYESIKNIADTINRNSGRLDIGIGNSTPNTEEKAALNKIASNNWTVYVNGSAYSPTSVSSIMTLDEDGNEVETPIPFYAKPVPATEETASYIDSDGNYYNILGAQFIYGDDLSTYGMFTCEADAAANMRLTKIEE